MSSCTQEYYTNKKNAKYTISGKHSLVFETEGSRKYNQGKIVTPRGVNCQRKPRIDYQTV